MWPWRTATGCLFMRRFSYIRVGCSARQEGYDWFSEPPRLAMWVFFMALAGSTTPGGCRKSVALASSVDQGITF